MSNRIIFASLVIIAALAFNSTASVAGPLDDYRRMLMQQCNQDNVGRDREARQSRRQCRREVRQHVRQMRREVRAEYRQCRRTRPRIPHQECRDRRQEHLLAMLRGIGEADL